MKFNSIHTGLAILGLTVTTLVAQEAANTTNVPDASGSNVKAVAVPTNDKLRSVVEEVQKLHAKQRYFEALQKLNDADAIAPNDPIVSNIRGSVYTAMRDFVKAREAFEKAQTLTPNAFEPKFNIAELSYVEQKYPEAEAAFSKLLQENPKLREEVRHLSQFKVLVSQLKQGKVAEAEKTSLVFTFMDDTPAYYFSKAAFEFQKDNKDGAREWLVKTDKIYKPQQNAVYLDTLMEARWIPSLTVPSDPKK